MFIINVELWRNVCPLATLNLLFEASGSRRQLPKDWLRIAGIVGIILLAVMVPARRFLFNVDATALGVTVVAVCVLALLGGLLFDMKGGFCNALCPVLPVERLYGQRPLLSVPNARCLSCTACTRGCLDLIPTKSAVLSVGNHAGSPRWTVSGYGIFALAFPGFVVAYYLLPDGGLGDMASTYGTVGLWSVGSWLVLASLFTVSRTSPAHALLLCAGLAIGLYYWFAPPGIAAQFWLPAAFTWALRAVTLALVSLWLIRGRRVSGNGTAPATT
ncbi:MAG: hypothetical protein O2958_14825 [Gemmatimonadetes bacterium]|nr:hypothetical protein [Gemmatimonadota bacterium]